VEFSRVNRHFNVPLPEKNCKDDSEIADAMRFYKWVHQIHLGYRYYQDGNKTILNDDRVKQLLDLGFEFKVDEKPVFAKDTAITKIPFEKRAEQMQRFQQELGHLNIDHRYDKLDNFGGWAANISKRYKDWQEGREAISPLEEHQFDQLSALGFEFNVIPSAVRSMRTWDENFNTFLEFQAVNGHPHVPRKYKADLRLGVWAGIQRREYKLRCEGKPSKLSEERYKKLVQAGFPWEVEKSSSIVE